MSLVLAPHRKTVVPSSSTSGTLTPTASARVPDASKRRHWYEAFADKDQLNTRQEYEKRYDLTPLPGRRASIDPKAAKVAPEQKVLERVPKLSPSEVPVTYVSLPKDYYLYKFKRHPITGRITLACDHPWTDFTLIDLKASATRRLGNSRLAAKGVTSPVDIKTLTISEIAFDPFYFKATVLPMRSWYFSSLMEQKHGEWSAQVGRKKALLRPPKQQDIFVQALKASLVDTPNKYTRGSHSAVMIMVGKALNRTLNVNHALCSLPGTSVVHGSPRLVLSYLSSAFGAGSPVGLNSLLLSGAVIQREGKQLLSDAASGLGNFEIAMIIVTILLLTVDLVLGDLMSLATTFGGDSRLEILAELPGRVFLCRRLGSHKGLPQGAKNKSQLVSSTVSSHVIGTKLAAKPPPDLCIVAYVEGALVELTPVEAEYLRKLSESCKIIIAKKAKGVPPIIRMLGLQIQLLSMGCTSSNHRIITPAVTTTEKSRPKQTQRRPGRSRLEESDEGGSDISSSDDDDSGHKLERSKSGARIAGQCAQSSVAAVRRMAAEAKHMQKHKIEGVSAYPASEGSMLQWLGFINGPEGTPYEGGSFTIDIDIPEDYPFKPPKMRFRTPIWHPNITGDGRGRICMDILKADHWSALLTLQTALLSLVSLLADPNTGDPLNVEASDELEHFPELFNAKAREWTLKHASCRGQVSRITVARHEDDNAYLQCDHTGQVIDEDEALEAAIEHSLRCS
ncbi:ubiquitin-conjugating enzyme E2 K [Perkinsus olseni]|uniref:Ubiquitin-conjugating enzyme E2 K n=1 Tax=Perkinsus olseni TaxID=32597 RepID=A0A7J6M3M8_PEROL|nr:ubiquitin-conjugating enzyme E2 K [Perkinsus olseni]